LRISEYNEHYNAEEFKKYGPDDREGLDDKMSVWYKIRDGMIEQVVFPPKPNLSILGTQKEL
jgi:hypothetical protein